MTTPPEILRARFEKWAQGETQQLYIGRWGFDLNSPFASKNGEYASGATQASWLAYQAATAKAERGMVEAVGILKKLVDYPNETSVSDDERALWADARALLARLKKGEAA